MAKKQTSTINVGITLDKDFITQYNKLQAEYGTDIARLNGFGDDQLSYTDFIDNFIDDDTIADVSIDGNSNVRRKDIVTLITEMPKPHRKLLAYNKIYYEFKKKYGFKAANTWLEYEWSGKLYLHDADTSSMKPYCFAYDLKDLAERGLYFLGINNTQPAQHLTTFVDFVKEFISFASNRSSGAVGLPNIIPYMFYYWRKDVKSDYLGVRTSGNEKKYAIQNFQRFIYAVNQPCVRDGQQSAFTNTTVFDRPYFEALFGGTEFPDGSFMIDAEEDIIEFQKWYMETMAEIRSENMFTFPVSTISLIRKNGKFEDEEFAHWAIRHNMKWCDSNMFIDKDVTSLSNCCRLKSQIDNLGYFNSIGGTALKVGSVKVGTINLARIALDTENETEYLTELKKRTLIDLKVLDIIRSIIKRNVDKGLLPNFTYELIDFKHLYNTVGFTGVYESMKKFGYISRDLFNNVSYTEQAEKFGKKIFDTIRKTADKFLEDNTCDYLVSLEQSPVEQAASKLIRKDKFFYPESDIYDLPVYGNQFMPLGIKSTLQERIRVQALFDSFCSGGSILHANIETPFDSYEKALAMTEYVADQGVTYFAWNTKISACEHNHAFHGKICPKCGKPVKTEYTRVVGFYTPIESWSSDRKAEYKLRQWEVVNET